MNLTPPPPRRVPDASVPGPVAPDFPDASPSGIPDGPAWRIPVGIVAPYDMALDSELWRWVPDTAALLFARTPYEALPVTLEMVRLLGDEAALRATTEQLKMISPAAYAFACTSGSFVNGRDGERAIATAMAEAGGAPAVTTSGAVVAALAALGAGAVAIATPYDAEITAKLARFLAEHEIDVTGAAHLGLDSEIWAVPYRRTAELIRQANTPDAQAIVVSCTNLPTYDLISPLEAELGKPIVSANQATMWAVLRAVGLEAVGPGQRLLEATLQR
ncbi:Asp/Glu racemase [Homoserinimonas sp. OAct 916]|uniref:maleate cis-trans isomerase family protein n=1 Tax=Homoserinimonas sp. OAct 916 TaxID=2211450 RepID=UPI001300AA74|nr:Asp/Glu racemase [Homoserinimonas sp. OAct 916]